MTNYINIDDIQDARWKSYAKKVDQAKPSADDPNSVGDYNDNRLSEREIKKVETMIREYFNQNPEYDAFGSKKPVDLSVSDAVRTMFGSTASYAKFQLDTAVNSAKRTIARISKWF